MIQRLFDRGGMSEQERTRLEHVASAQQALNDEAQRRAWARLTGAQLAAIRHVKDGDDARDR